MPFRTFATILFTLVSLIHGAIAQVWTEPAFPTQFDDITVYFDATQGNAALAGFTGDVYAHAGLITSESQSGNDWKYVIGNWGTADSRVLMTSEGNDIYSLSYNITEFHSVPAQEEVLQLAFVFRNVSGSIVGRASDGSDIFTDVYPPGQGLFITLRSPSESNVIIFEGDSLLVDVSVSDTVDLQILDDGEQIFVGNVHEAMFYHHPTSVGTHTLRVEAMLDTVTAVVESQYFVLSHNPDQIDPPGGTINGLNYCTDSTYLFQLYAPLKVYAFLLCPANNYQPADGFQMQIAEDGGTYWIELPRSTFSDGKNTYQYLVSGGVRIADPHSEVVLDPWNDQWVSPQVLATLPAYPDGMTMGIVTAFDTIYEPFDFHVQSFEKPAKESLVIYELLLRDFLADHSFESLLDTLDYFQRLGVNAIELMPTSEFEGNDSWGYNVSFHMAVDKYYGTRDQLKAFIDAAHERGIAVIQDVVFNHVFSQGPLAQLYWDPVNFRPSAESPYLNVIARHPFNVGYDFNHESIATKNWVRQVLTYWIEEFKFDGFRFDLSKGMTQYNSGNDAGLMSRYDASRIAILKDYADHIWAVDSTSYVILEHFADNDEEIELSNYGMMLWGNMNHQFGEAAMGYSSDLEWIDYTFRGWNNPNLVGYLESHDEERLMYRLHNFGDSEGNYNTRETTTALERVAAASAIFYSIPGPKMLWEFGELGYDYSINTCTNGTVNNDCRLSPKPIRWDYLEDYRRERLRHVTSALIYLHTTHPTFSTDNFVFSDQNFYVKAVYLYHPDMDAVTLANFRVINSEVNPKFPYAGRWYEYFTGDSIDVTDTQARITFSPGEYRIYTSERLTPPGGFISSVRNLPVHEVTFYPSLFSTEQSVYTTFKEPVNPLAVHLYDMTGKMTKSCYYESDEEVLSVFIKDGLPAGMYVICVQTADAFYVGKVLKQ